MVERVIADFMKVLRAANRVIGIKALAFLAINKPTLTI
jgi:hypothetical protein